MKAKRVVASGVVAALIGLAPTLASAEGFYLTAFGGITSADIDEGAFDASYGPVLQQRGQLTISDGTDDHVFSPAASNYQSGSVDDSGIGWGLQVGYEFNPYVALEVGYVDLGKYRQEGGSILATYTSETDPTVFDVPADVSARIVSAGPTLAVVGKFPFGSGFSVYGRGGVYFADTRARLKYMGVADEFSPDQVLELPLEFKASTQELFLGLGAGWDFSEDFGLRLDFQMFMDVGDEDRTGESDLGLFSVGVTFR